jgi:hypothetical protein
MSIKEKRAVQNKIRRFYHAATGRRLPLLMTMDELLSRVDDVFHQVSTLREETLQMLGQ